MNIDAIDRKTFVGVGIGFLFFVVMVNKLGSKNVENLSVVISLIFAVIYVIVFGLVSSPRYSRAAVTTLLIFCTVMEICFADTGNFVMSQSKKAYTSDYELYQQISEAAEKDENEPFYRTELTNLRTRMDPSWYGYNGVSVFSSMAYEHAAKLMKKLGLFGNNINSYTYNPQTAVFNSMFAIKYIYDNNSLINNSNMYTAKGSNDIFKAYEYNYYLPIAYVTDKNILNWDTENSNPFMVQNDYISSSTGVDDVLEGVEATDVSVTNLDSVSLSAVNSGTKFSVKKTSSGSADCKVYIDVKEAGNYYVYVGSTNISSVAVTADNFDYSYYSSSLEPLTLDVGFQELGSRIEIKYTLSDDSENASVTFCAAKLNDSKFIRAYNTIRENGTLQLSAFDESSFTGTVNVKNSGSVLYTSIPYDESWNIVIDGEKQSYGENGSIVKIGSALIGVEIPEGMHTVEFKYVPKGLSLGFKLTALGMLIIAVYLIYKFWFFDLLNKNGNRKKLFSSPDYYNE